MNLHTHDKRSLGGLVDPVNLLDYRSVRQMFPVLLTFYGAVYSNMKESAWHRRTDSRREGTHSEHKTTVT